MRKVFEIVWKDARIYFSDRSEILFFFILPLVFTAVVGMALSEGDATADDRIPVLVADEGNSTLSAELNAALASSKVIRPILQPRDEAERLLKEATAPALVVIPAGFGKALLSGQAVELALRKSPSDNRVSAVEQSVRAAASQVSNAVAAALISVAEAEHIRPFASEAARQAYFQQSLTMAQEVLKNPPARLEATQALTAVPKHPSGFQQSSAGQLVSWVSVTLIAASETLLDERLGGTLRRLLVTPTSKATILLGKIVGRLAMGIVQMILLIVCGALIFRVNWGQSPAALASVMFSFGLAAVAFGVFIGTIAKTRGQAGGLSILFGMLMSAIGGAWFPLEITGKTFTAIGHLVPNAWAMDAFNDVLVRGQGIAGVLPEVGVLFGYALVFFVIGIRRFRYE